MHVRVCGVKCVQYVCLQCVCVFYRRSSARALKLLGSEVCGPSKPKRRARGRRDAASHSPQAVVKVKKEVVFRNGTGHSCVCERERKENRQGKMGRVFLLLFASSRR